MRRKITCFFLLALLFTFLCFSACASNQKTEVKQNDKITVLVDSFPVYDWARNIIGESDAYELDLLVDNGVDIHSYQPSMEDIVKLKNSDIFIYVGGESSQWINEALEEVDNPDIQVICLLDEIEDYLLEEEITEEMQSNENEEESSFRFPWEKQEDEEEEEFDEHIWLSLKNSQECCKVLKGLFIENDGQQQNLYEKNAELYIEKLSVLDESFSRKMDEITNKTVLFADRFPFRYLFEDYGIQYYAAFPGCSAESEASFETIIKLSEIMKEKELKSIAVIDGSNVKVANTLISTLGNKEIKIYTLNSLQAVSRADIDKGVTYLDVMEGNLKGIIEYLK